MANKNLAMQEENVPSNIHACDITNICCKLAEFTIQLIKN